MFQRIRSQMGWSYLVVAIILGVLAFVLMVKS